MNREFAFVDTYSQIIEDTSKTDKQKVKLLKSVVRLYDGGYTVSQDFELVVPKCMSSNEFVTAGLRTLSKVMKMKGYEPVEIVYIFSTILNNLDERDQLIQGYSFLECAFSWNESEYTSPTPVIENDLTKDSHQKSYEFWNRVNQIITKID